MKTNETKLEEDKRVTSEYVKILFEATKCRKTKKFKSALEKYLECYSLIENTEMMDKQFETSYYLGHCYLKLNKINEGYHFLSKSNDLVDQVSINSLDYDKAKGKLSAHMIILKYAIGTSKEAIAFARNIVNHIESTKELIEKMKLFYYFIKELLSFMKNNKKVVAFFNDYQSAKNEIIYNNEQTLSLSLKVSFNALMNSSTKISLLQMNDIMYYNIKHGLASNHPLISFMDKNSDLLRDSNSQRAKTCFDSFMKSNKIKLGVSSIELIQEQKARIDNFNELFAILAQSFNLIFKNYLSFINKIDTELTIGSESPKKNQTPSTKNNNNSKVLFQVQFNNGCNLNNNNIIHSNSNQVTDYRIPIKPASASNKNLSRLKPQLGIEGLNNWNKNKDLLPNGCKSNNSISPIKTNVFNKRNTLFSFNNHGHMSPLKANYHDPKTQMQIISLCAIKPCDTETTKTSMNDTNNNFTQFGSEIIEDKDKVRDKTKDKEKEEERIKDKANNSKENKHEPKEETNSYDQSRIENISIANDPSFNIKRKRNIVLFQTIVDELSKGKKIRECDILSTKIQSYVKDYSMLSLQGNHHTYGESLSVNQDICFSYENFLLLRNLHFFGVCDGHGDFGHLVSEHVKVYLPANIQYIELDNYLIRKNKNITNLITSLYTVNEKSTVKDMNIIKYFYDKFAINHCDMSLYKKAYNEINNVLKEAFRQTHEDLLKQNINSKSSGTTACTLFLHGKRIFLANVGDSRAILGSCHGNWTVSQLTKDHKPNDSEERDRIIKSNGRIKRLYSEDSAKEIGPYRVWFLDETRGPGLAMSRSIGDYSAKEIGVLAEPDTYEYCLNKNDKFIIIASDGVWEYITCQEALDIVKNVYLDYSRTAVDACALLTQTATQRWKKKGNKTIDDITCVIIFLQVEDSD